MKAESQSPFATSTSVATHRQRLKAVARRHLDDRLAPRLDASDIAQETFLELSRNDGLLEGLDPEEQARMLKHVAKLRSLDAARRHIGAARRSILRERPQDPTYGSSHDLCLKDLLPAPDAPADHQVMRLEQIDAVRRCLAELPERDRRILELRQFVKLSVRECADLLGVNPSVVTSRYLRALRKLREALQRDTAGREALEEYQRP